MVESSPRQHRRHALAPEGPDYLAVAEKEQAKREPGRRRVDLDRAVAKGKRSRDPAGAREAHREAPAFDRSADRLVSFYVEGKSGQYRPQQESRGDVVGSRHGYRPSSPVRTCLKLPRSRRPIERARFQGVRGPGSHGKRIAPEPFHLDDTPRAVRQPEREKSTRKSHRSQRKPGAAALVLQRWGYATRARSHLSKATRRRSDLRRGADPRSGARLRPSAPGAPAPRPPRRRCPGAVRRCASSSGRSAGAPPSPPPRDR